MVSKNVERDRLYVVYCNFMKVPQRCQMLSRFQVTDIESSLFRPDKLFRLFAALLVLDTLVYF